MNNKIVTLALKVFIVSGLLFGAIPSIHAAYIYNILDAPSATTTNARGLNDTGDVVGWYEDNSFTRHGFFYDGTYTTLDAPGASVTEAHGINNSGTIVGFYSDGSGNHGFSLVGTTYNPLDAPGASFTAAYDINNTGTIVGAYTDGSGTHGFFYNGVSYTTLDVPGATSTQAYGINDTGLIVGWYEDAGGSHGFLYNGVSYTTLDVPGANSTSAYGINNVGLIVGSYMDSNFLVHGYLYDGSSYTQVGPSGGGYVEATDINLTDDIAGWFTDGSGSHGFVTTQTADLSASPSFYDFGSLRVGHEFAAMQFAITNNDASAVNILDIVLGDTVNFSLDLTAGTNPCGSTTPTLAAGASCTVIVVFEPVSAGTFNTDLSIDPDHATMPTLVIPLAGTGVEGISVTPTDYDFGNAVVGGAVGVQPFLILNEGVTAVNVSQIIVEDTINFSVDVNAGTNPCGSTTPTIAAGANCTLHAKFHPGSAGAFNTNLIISSDDAFTPTLTVPLMGTGSIATEPEIKVTDSLPPIDDLQLPFWDVMVNTSSETQTVALSNLGTGDLTVTDIQLTGTDAADFILNVNPTVNPCGSPPLTIPAGGNCTVKVTFSPTTLGAKTASLDISSNDADEAIVNLALSGNSVARAAILSIVKTVNDSTVVVGDTVSFNITVTNSGPLDATGVEVTDLLPAGLNFQNYNANPAAAYDLATGIWSIGSLALDGTATLTIDAEVLGVVDDSFVTNTAEVTASDPDTYVGIDDTATIGVGGADLAIEVTADKDSLLNDGREEANVTIVVTNNGPKTAHNVTIDLQLDSYLRRDLLLCSGELDNGFWIDTLEPGASIDQCITIGVWHTVPRHYSDIQSYRVDVISSTFDPVSSNNWGGGSFYLYYPFGKGPICFIATAAYGSYLDPHVKVLRDFRDNYLLTNGLGQIFVDWYYRTSPPIAAVIAKHDSLRLATRILLTPLVFAVEYPGVSGLATLFGVILLAHWYRRKRVISGKYFLFK